MSKAVQRKQTLKLVQHIATDLGVADSCPSEELATHTTLDHIEDMTLEQTKLLKAVVLELCIPLKGTLADTVASFAEAISGKKPAGILATLREELHNRHDVLTTTQEYAHANLATDMVRLEDELTSSRQKILMAIEAQEDHHGQTHEEVLETIQKLVGQLQDTITVQIVGSVAMQGTTEEDSLQDVLNEHQVRVHTQLGQVAKAIDQLSLRVNTLIETPTMAKERQLKAQARDEATQMMLNRLAQILDRVSQPLPEMPQIQTLPMDLEGFDQDATYDDYATKEQGETILTVLEAIGDCQGRESRFHQDKLYELTGVVKDFQGQLRAQAQKLERIIPTSLPERISDLSQEAQTKGLVAFLNWLQDAGYGMLKESPQVLVSNYLSYVPEGVWGNQGAVEEIPQEAQGDVDLGGQQGENPAGQA